jgi:hypothetical protein
MLSPPFQFFFGVVLINSNLKRNIVERYNKK